MSTSKGDGAHRGSCKAGRRKKKKRGKDKQTLVTSIVITKGGQGVINDKVMLTAKLSDNDGAKHQDKERTSIMRVEILNEVILLTRKKELLHVKLISCSAVLGYSLMYCQKHIYIYEVHIFSRVLHRPQVDDDKKLSSPSSI